MCIYQQENTIIVKLLMYFQYFWIVYSQRIPPSGQSPALLFIQLPIVLKPRCFSIRINVGVFAYELPYITKIWGIPTEYHREFNSRTVDLIVFFIQNKVFGLGFQLGI